MPEFVTPKGVVVRFPDTLQVTEAPPRPATGTRRIPLPTGPISVAPPAGGSDFTTDILDAMSEQELEVLQELELQPRPSATGVRAIPVGNPSVEIEADVADDEDAVVLTEQDGLYTWHISRGAPTSGVRTLRTIPTGAKTRHFEIELYPAEGEPGQTRNILTDFVVDHVRAWVLKFAAKAAVGEAVKHLERNTRTGFVFLTGNDTEAWLFEATPAPLLARGDRPLRVLLFIHGTFSSTIGGFGALTGTPWGQEFLAATRATYDSVIGFDHPTLRNTPVENATALLALLQNFVPQGTQIDVITHSRGGLVFRSLSEIVLPSAAWQPQIGRVVMVAAPNGGTLLAEPENWKTLIDLYTNIAVGACRLLALMPQATAVSKILKELFSSLGEFLKYLAVDFAGEGGVPGLDAMRTSGDFVKELNETQPGQPGPGALALYAITSEFKPTLTGPDAQPAELPKRLLLTSAGALINQLMKEANDLVVNTASMVEVDAAAGSFITDQFSFGATGKVYHTTYFIRPETVNAITRWLRLVTPAISVKPIITTQKRSAPVATADVPALVDTDITLLDATDLSEHAIAWISAFSPSFAVIRRREDWQNYYYAYPGEELLQRLQWVSPQTDLMDALNLHEWMESPSQTLSTAARVVGSPGVETSSRGVVFAGDLPVGVVPAASDFIANDALPDVARIIVQPPTAGAAPTIRRTMPTFGPIRIMRSGAPSFSIPAAAPPPPPAPAPPAKVGLHFLAEMPCEVKVGAECSVAVTISREMLAAAQGVASAMGGGDADAGRKLIIQIIPRAQFSIAEERTKVDVPEPGKPASFYFDLTATHEGDGEIWVIFRQDATPICTLILQPKVVAAPVAAERRLHAEAEAGTAEIGALHQLRIMDLRNGVEVRYRFELYSPTLALLKEYESKSMKEDVSAYVNRLYADIEQRWLSTSGDQKDFAAEMRAFGADLFENLFPAELQKVLWDHRNDIQSIMVISTEPFIPWEMVLVKEPGAKGLAGESRFLAEMGLVRWLYAADYLPPTQLRIRAGRARYVIPQYPVDQYVLPEALEEAGVLQTLFGATSVEPQITPVRELLGDKSFDLLHFACHAGAEGDNVSAGRILLQGRIEGTGRDAKYIPATLDAINVEHYADLQGADGTRPVIVLNACQGARAGFKLSSTGGFAQSFLKGGAGAFIAALWSVGDQPARTFTEEFYKQLKNNEPVAKAASLARAAAQKSGDATWLAYAVYAHPNAILASN